jgi:predicted transcriptional regulator of viral defense system
MSSQDRRSKRRNLVGFASLQSGYFTAAQALEAGYSYQAQRYNVQQGNWLRVDRGSFRLPEWPPGQREDLVRWTLWSRHRAVVSHQTALSVHELGDVNPARVHLTVPPGFRKTVPGIVLYRGELSAEDIGQREGYSVTVPMRSILDASAAMETDQLARVIEDALARGLVTKRGLRERADAFGPAAALALERALMREAD